MLTYLVTLIGILVIVMAVVVAVIGLFLWTRYRMQIDAAQQVTKLIEANRATARPGMTQPDDRFRQAAEARARRHRGPYAG